MSNSEQLEAKTNGKNIALDGVTIINEGVELSKEEAKTEEAAPVVAEDEVEAPVVPEVAEETPAAVEETQAVEMPQINVPTPEIEPKAVAPVAAIELPPELNPVLSAPTPETTIQTTEEQPAFDNSNNNIFTNYDFNQNNNDGVPETNNYNSVEEQPSSFSSLQSDNQSDSALFNSQYQDNELVKIPTIVTKEHAQEAKDAFLGAVSKSYDVLNGQIEPVRQFAEDAALWIEDVKKAGFVSGYNQDLGSKILRKYYGLKEENNNDNVASLKEETPINDNVIPFGPTQNFNDSDVDDNTYGMAV